MSNSGPICVVHLVRGLNGIEPFERFIASYRCHDPGVEHELVLLYKGFPDPGAVAQHRELMAGIEFEEHFISDRGFDLDAYVGLASQISRSRYCFLNSYSQILAAGWLSTLDAALLTPGVGLVGATGSWASVLSYALYELRLPSAYRSVFPDYRRTRAGMMALSADASPAGAGARRDLRSLLVGGWSALERLFGFERFPARHVRSNAFALGAEALARLEVPELRRKAQAYRLESGSHSLTRQIERLGLSTLVAGRDGVLYEPADWAASETLWQGAQRNLLVSDNQTDKYAAGDADVRQLLSSYAWGARARPVPGATVPTHLP
jgi:hypothetical protein